MLFVILPSKSYLLALANNIDTNKMPAPSFMAVIIGVGKYAYRRKDGVYVIPIGCLKDWKIIIRFINSATNLHYLFIGYRSDVMPVV